MQKCEESERKNLSLDSHNGVNYSLEWVALEPEALKQKA